MIEKLDTTIEEMLKEKLIKTKWTEIENYGLAELLGRLFEDNPYHDTIASIPIVEDRVVCLDLYSGVMQHIGDEIHTFKRVYIDVEGNAVFLTTKGEVFLYETESIDAEDPRHYFEGE